MKVNIPRKEAWKWSQEVDEMLKFYRNKFCECGCGNYLNPSRKQIRDSKSKKKPLRVLKGHHQRLPEAGKWIKRGEDHPMYGKTHTKEALEKMSKTWFKKLEDPITRKSLLHRRGWESIRSKALARDKNKCLKCSKSNKEIRIDIHHIINRKFYKSRFRANSLDNLISLCYQCHMILENILRKQVKTGLIAGKSRTDNQQRSQEITNRFLERSTIRIDESIISTNAPPVREDMI